MASQTSIYEDLRDMVESEIEKLTKKDDLDEKSLMYLDKLVDIAKDSYEIEMGYEQFGGDEYSQRMEFPWHGNSYNNSYGYGNNGTRYSGQRRDSRGRYARSYNASPYYSGTGFQPSEDLVQKLEQLMNQAQSEHERNAIRQVLESM